MRILQLCHKVPYPPRDGGSIAMNNLTQGLINTGNQVRVLAINTPNNLVYLDELDQEYVKSTRIEAVYIDTAIRISAAFFNLFTDKSYNIERFISDDFDSKLAEILQEEEYDIVQLESLFIAPYLATIRKYSKAKVVLRSHNVEFEIWQRRSATCKNPLKKAYLSLLTTRLKKYEIDHMNKYDAIACITTRDMEMQKELGSAVPMTDIPVGVDEIKDAIVEIADPVSLFHLGSMDWMPNLEAIEWFLNDVWEDVKKAIPEIKLNLAGKSMPQWLLNTTDPNMETMGHIKDARQYMNNNGIMIVPLLSGSGMRVKIIEGMALGKVIISTAIGAEGIEYEHGKDIFIADTPNEFVQAIVKCSSDIDLCKAVGRNAKELVRNKYDNIVISQKLIEFYKSLS